MQVSINLRWTLNCPVWYLFLFIYRLYSPELECILGCWWDGGLAVEVSYMRVDYSTTCGSGRTGDWKEIIQCIQQLHAVFGDKKLRMTFRLTDWDADRTQTLRQTQGPATARFRIDASQRVLKRTERVSSNLRSCATFIRSQR